MKKCIFSLIATVFIATSSFAQDVFQAARVNDVAAIEQAIANDMDVNQSNSRGFTPLILAVYNESYEVATLLLKNGANADAQDLSGNTALMGAIFKGYPKMAELLIAHQADVNKCNFNQASPLVFAATFGQKEIAEMLLKKGADKNAKDNTGKTALDHATLQGNNDMMLLLKQ